MMLKDAGASPSLRRKADPRTLLFVVLACVLIYQVVLPLLMILWTSLKVERPGEPGFMDLDITLFNYARALGDSRFWSATWATLAFACASTAISFSLGGFLSWALDRTNTPLSRLISLLLVGRIIVPGILIVVSWILLASPNIGILNAWVFNVFGVRNFFNIYSFWGMVWVQSLEMVPLTYLLLSGANQAMDPRLEEASIMTGASIWRTLRKITLPLSWPAIAAALLLLFITTIESFEVPLLMGGRANVTVYTTEIYRRSATAPTDWGLAATYAIALLFFCSLLLSVYFWMVRHSERYQTITGKDFKPRRSNLGKWRYLTCAISLLIVFLTTGIPFLMMLYVSFLTMYQPPSAAAFASMSLVNYERLFSNPQYAVYPLINSTIVGIVTASVVVLTVAAISYCVHKTNFRGRKILDYLAFASISVPSVTLGAAFLWFYLLVPLPVIGTLLIIILALITKFMPVALRFTSASMMKVHPELEEAALVSGASSFKNFFRIFLPLIKAGVLAAWFWVMVHAFRELTIALMLSGSDNRTAAVVIFDLWGTGRFTQLAAFGVIMFLILIVLVGLSNLVSRRFGVKES